MHQNYALCTIRGCTMNTRHSLSSFFSGEEIFKNPKSTSYFPPLFLMVKGNCSTASAYDVTQWTVVSIQLEKNKAKSKTKFTELIKRFDLPFLCHTRTVTSAGLTAAGLHLHTWKIPPAQTGTLPLCFNISLVWWTKHILLSCKSENKLAVDLNALSH